ncbi:MAG: hypothetical protein DRN53_04905, partial [Thermoprotei archaeon]
RLGMETRSIEKLRPVKIGGIKIGEIGVLEFQLTNSIKFRCIKQARKEKKEVVNRDFAKKVLSKLRKKLISLKPEDILKIYYDSYHGLKERIGLTETRILLDLGCGWGRVVGVLKLLGLSTEFIGLDSDLEALKYGKEVDSNIHFIHGNIENLPLRDEIADVVLCIHVLHEIKTAGRDISTALGEMIRTLKPNGLLHITDFLVSNPLVGSLLCVLGRVIKAETSCTLSELIDIVGRLGMKTRNIEELRPVKISGIKIGEICVLEFQK